MWKSSIYLEDKMNYTYLPHTDFKCRFSKAWKKAIGNRTSILDTFKLLPIEETMVPSSEICFYSFVRYLCDIFVMYSRFVGGNCRYVGPSDI